MLEMDTWLNVGCPAISSFKMKGTLMQRRHDLLLIPSLACVTGCHRPQGMFPTIIKGGIAARAEADAADLGVLGASNVSEWPCLNMVAGFVMACRSRFSRIQTLRPSGKYTGPFRKCFAMVIKVHGSEVDKARLLSKKLLFMLVRAIDLCSN